MTKTAYIDLTTPEEEAFFKHLQPQDRFVNSRVVKKISFFSRNKKTKLKYRSLLPQIAELWNNLSTEQKALWTTAGSYCGLNGYRCFTAEMSIRLKLEMSTNYTPSIYHQAWFGHLIIANPAQQIKIAQYHPSKYYVNQKVKGTKSQYSPVFVEEKLSLPLEIGLSYCSDLTAVGGAQYIKFYAIVLYSYQGITREEVLQIDLDSKCDWKKATATLNDVIGYVIGYTLYIHIYGYTGDFYFDNIICKHNGTNFARDKNCTDINFTFSRAYYQIPKNWAGVEIPSGAVYDSDYRDF